MLDVAHFSGEQWRGLSFAAGQDAGNAQARKNSRSAWNLDDRNLAATVTNKMLRCHPEFSWLPEN